ncbi:protein translocase subunit SecD [Heliorestis acidaminivorans]|uniref:Multifunctional fusion protein n=1 Tax=Heliorestis acidaminivorans TaxID=553427 RepID=A0A6I0EPR5_9FIRM|nr:protein translocase subunit SecD [Heliorestis acidaminivorans]KAB2951261.1 protein translocase subunit SecD [Heliorestis acidaminivorans]
MKTRSTLQMIALLLLVTVAVTLSYNPILQGTKLGLDLQGGLHVVLQAVEGPEEGVTQREMEQVKAIMEQRINGLGVEEPLIQIQGADRLIIELAGIDDPDRAIELIGKTAMLTFRTEDGQVVVEGQDLRQAREQIVPGGTEAIVTLSFNTEGTSKFADATRANLNRTIGIYLDDELLQNPVVRSVIVNGEAQITGYENLEEARRIALLLNSGALPVKLDMIEKRTVGPSLGADSLSKSQSAALIGLGLVIAFMILYYRVPGFIATVSLALYAVIVMGILALLNATLTLPGIFGLLLSVGMAVDANIIIYERIKEEIREGKSLRAAIEGGFNRAFRAILDANVTTLIIMVILYFLTTGLIRGFAITLGLGILASMFTAITFTRWMLRSTAGSGMFKNHKYYGAKEGDKQLDSLRQINLMAKRKTWYGFSALLIIPAILSLLLQGLNFGIDFTGGSMMQVKFEQATTVEEVRTVLGQHDLATATIQASNDNDFIIRTKVLEHDERTEVLNSLKSQIAPLEVQRDELVGPVIGKELAISALLALAAAAVFMVGYITVRFEFKFAVAAISALLHDVLIVVGIFSLFQIEITTAFVAAILTVIGYSINDTIIIFDRVRENYGKIKKKDDLEEMVNRSLWDTMTRSINTALTVIFVLVALLFWGGETTKDLALAILIGVTVGVYSSIFHASPIWLDLKNWERAQRRKRRTNTEAA